MKIIKLISLIFILMIATRSFSQRFTTKTGHIWFQAEAPFDAIEAHNTQVDAALDINSGAVDFKILMQSFIFEKALMQEQFNKNYIESEKFPNAAFQGKISNIDAIDFTKPGYMLPNAYDIEISGELTMHGVTKPVNATGFLEVKNNMIHGISKFNIVMSDYNIQILGTVAGKVPLEIEINVETHLKEYMK
jgi:polyisoprenoid-binding protein YceI